MAAQIISINPYTVLGKCQHAMDQLMKLAERRQDEEFGHGVANLKALHDELLTAMNDERRARLKNELEASIKLMRNGGGR